MAAYRKAVDAELKDAQAWNNLCAQLLRSKRTDEALDAGRQAAALGAGHYNLAGALALSGQSGEALTLLAKCLANNEITKAHVAQDPDWVTLRTHPEFLRLIQTD